MHAGLRAEITGLASIEGKNVTRTPEDKRCEEDRVADTSLHHEDEAPTITSLRHHPRARSKPIDGAGVEVKQQVIFQEHPGVSEAPPPTARVARTPPQDAPAGWTAGESQLVDVAPECDPFTGLLPRQLKPARGHWKPSTQERADKH